MGRDAGHRGMVTRADSFVPSKEGQTVNPEFFTGFYTKVR